VYVLGGVGYNPETTSRPVVTTTGGRERILEEVRGSTSMSEILRPGSSVWEEGPGLPGGEGLTESCAVAISNTTFLLIGGYRSVPISGSIGISGAVHEFSSLTGAWTQWPEGLSVPRAGHACSNFNGTVVVAGGYTDGGFTDGTDILDPETRQVEQAGQMATPRSGFGMYNIGYAGSRILLTFGSYARENEEAEKESLLQEWDPTDKVWKAAPAVMARRADFSAVTVKARHVCPQGELLGCSKV
jgi:hypothetical protein